MKLKIETDAGYAFDYLSILEVKKDQINDKTSRSHFNECYKFLKGQMNEGLFRAIVDSKEYEDLYEANLRVWDLVDLAKTDSVAASVVDRANFERWKCKKRLQEHFFSGSIAERKVGYDKYLTNKDKS